MLTDAPPSPEEVIRGLREADDYLRLIFMNGGCWRFSKFLALLFPEAKPFKVAISTPDDFDHIITKIGSRVYDITGEVHEEDFRSCAPVKIEDIPTFEKWSFSSSRLLFKRCPHCGEEIIFDAAGEIQK